MAANTTVTGEANVGFAEETRDYVNRVTNAWTEQASRATEAYNESANRWLGAVQQVVPSLAPSSVQVPDARQLWNAYFDVLEQTVSVQRQLAEQILDRFGGLVTIDGAPAHEKVAQRVSEATEQASSAAKDASKDGEQTGTDAKSGNGFAAKPQGVSGGASVRTGAQV